MRAEEHSRLETIDAILRAKDVRAQIHPIIERVRAELSRKPQAVMTWEPIPLDIFRGALPEGIRSSWVFILRAGANTGAERHPNSHQRMMSFEGTGDLQTEKSGQTFNSESVREQAVQGSTSNVSIREADLKWKSNVLGSEPEAPLERRWVSIPTNVWHRPVIPNDGDWVVVSFHTVPADELIEERPADAGGGQTKQMVYLEQELRKRNAPV
jgi:hypothetical protein